MDFNLEYNLVYQRLAAILYVENNRNRVLSHFIPATTFATGANPVTQTQYLKFKNRNLNDFPSLNNRGWWRTLNTDPNKFDGWNHGDHRDVPLFFTQDFFDEIVTRGDLKCVLN